MNLRYFLSGTQWLDLAATWTLPIPLLVLLLTGNFRKSYGTSLASCYVFLFLLALRENRILISSNIQYLTLLRNVPLTLHAIAATFFMVHFTDASRKKDQQLVLYMLVAGFTALVTLIGAKPVVFFIIQMACSLVLVIYGVSATRNLFDEFRLSTRAVGGRLVMVLSLLGGRLGLLGLYLYTFALNADTVVFIRAFEVLTLLMTLTVTIGLLRDAGYDPENEEEDDGPYEALRLDPE